MEIFPRCSGGPGEPAGPRPLGRTAKAAVAVAVAVVAVAVAVAVAVRE
ncbi:hypothetical protein ACWGKW_12250 [Streptomyces sp. NPDC054766]